MGTKPPYWHRGQSEQRQVISEGRECAQPSPSKADEPPKQLRDCVCAVPLPFPCCPHSLYYLFLLLSLTWLPSLKHFLIKNPTKNPSRCWALGISIRTGLNFGFLELSVGLGGEGRVRYCINRRWFWKHKPIHSHLENDNDLYSQSSD